MAAPNEPDLSENGPLGTALRGFNASLTTRCFLRAYIEGERIRLNPSADGSLGRIVPNPDGGQALVITGTTPDGRVVNINVHRADPTAERNLTTIRRELPDGNTQLFEYNESGFGFTGTRLYRGSVVTDRNGIDSLPRGALAEVMGRANHYSFGNGPAMDIKVKDDGTIEMAPLPGRRIQGGDTPFTPEGLEEHRRIEREYMGCRLGMAPSSSIRVGALRGPTASV